MSELMYERPALVVRLLGVVAAVLGGLMVCGLVWAGSETFARWSDVGRPLRAVPSLMIVAIAVAGAVLMGFYGASTAAGFPRAAGRTGLTAFLLGVFAILQGVMMLGKAAAGVPLALGIMLIGVALLITPGSRFALGDDGAGQAADVGEPALRPAGVGTGAVDPEIAAAGPPYPYPVPLPAEAKAAHIAALAAWRRRASSWVTIVFSIGVLAVGVPLLADSGRWSRGSAPIFWETQPALAACLLIGGVLLVAVTVRPVIHNARGITRHQRLLIAYGVRVDKNNREEPPAIPRSPQAFLR